MPPLSFECFQCGECCANLGLVYTIKEGDSDFRFLIHNNYTGEETPVSIDPDKRDLFLDTNILKKFPRICPFFRYQTESGKACCTIYLTRPDICRDYECWRLLILNHRGRRVGRVRYIRTLLSEDPVLTKLWDECIELNGEPDDRVWEDKMIRTLTRAQYTVRK
jgi:Fe-S-cluster containining protein